MDMATFSDFPIANGGFSDIYCGYLSDGTQVAVKALRISTNSINQSSKHLKVSAVDCDETLLTEVILASGSRTAHMEQV
jgi:hypothetical protein